jgi:hypothetical protein
MPLQREHIQFALIVLRSGMISRYQYVPFLSKLGFFFLSNMPFQRAGPAVLGGVLWQQ